MVSLGQERIIPFRLALVSKAKRRVINNAVVTRLEQKRKKRVAESERRMVHSIHHPRTMMIWNERIEEDV